MRDYIIATSSTSDLPRTFLDEHRIPFISYTYTVNGHLVSDDCREEARAEVYRGMRGGDKLKTSMINEETYFSFFEGLLREGQDVIFLDMSREMSVSYVNANNAAERIRRQYPDQRLYVMDTRCISGGLGLLVECMVRMKEAGKSFDEAVAWGESNKLKIAHRFTVDDLNYLKEGGRVSNMSAMVGSLLSIKPVLYVPDRGTLDVVKKARGRKQALKAIVESVCHDLSRIDPAGVEFRILHADCREDAEHVRDAVKAACPMVGDTVISSLGVVIGAHCGPGLLAVFYLCGGRTPDAG